MQGNRVFQGGSCILLSFAPCQAWRPLSRMNYMPIAIGKHYQPDIPASLRLNPAAGYQRPARNDGK